MQKQIFWLFRATESVYAKQFCEHGTIKFNTPRRWIQLEAEEGSGRGDIKEACFSAYDLLDVYNIINSSRARESVSMKTIGKLKYLTDENVIDSPAFCLFGLFNTSFEVKYFHETDREAEVAYVTENYFKDFYPYKTRSEIEAIETDQRPVFIIIKNPNLFFKKLKNTLIELGFHQSDIKIGPIDYINKDVPFNVTGPIGTELFIKDSRFVNQSELRVVLNSKNKVAMQRLNEANNIIHIGNLVDITEIHEYYLEYMIIEKENNILRFNLSVPKIVDFSGGTQEQLIDVLEEIKKDEKKNGPKKENAEVTKVVKDLLMEKYNVYDYKCFNIPGVGRLIQKKYIV